MQVKCLELAMAMAELLCTLETYMRLRLRLDLADNHGLDELFYSRLMTTM
jgi:hypothetical protein